MTPPHLVRKNKLTQYTPPSQLLNAYVILERPKRVLLQKIENCSKFQNCIKT